MSDLVEKAAVNLAAVREKKPLIHNITNFVVMNYTANALLAMGASPVMAHARSEVEEMVSFAGDRTTLPSAIVAAKDPEKAACILKSTIQEARRQ